MKALDILIVGASQAGLAMGYFLKKEKLSFAILGKEDRVGDPWRNRYDSLTLFTPRWLSALPGMKLAGDPEGYATKDEIADYLENYSAAFDLPLRLSTAVKSLEESGGLFYASTNNGTYIARKVIVATGPFQKAFIPAFARQLPGHVFQIHTSSYTNPTQLQPGKVLVIGAGNSGAQIAVELSSEREVFLSAGHSIKFFPFEWLGKGIFWWLKKIGLYDLSATTKLGEWVRRQGDPIFGKELQKLIRKGKVNLKPRASKAEAQSVIFEDGSEVEVQNIIWATGFHSDYSWMAIPDAFDEQGMPLHHQGISPVNGLFFLGLPWQRRRSSALIGGVGEDAELLLEHILEPVKGSQQQHARKQLAY
jgi:putative flavoprotein involved in K+ transport